MTHGEKMALLGKINMLYARDIYCRKHFSLTKLASNTFP